MSDNAFSHHDKWLITCFVIIGLSLFLLSFSLHLVRKIFTLVSFKDLPLMLSIISISLALLFLITFLSLDVARIFDIYDDSINFDLSVYKIQQFDRTKVMFMFFAFVFDLYKWCVFIASTGKDVRADQNLFEKRLQNLKVCLIAIQTSILLFSLTLIIMILSVSE
jgi:hypothetical protein